MRCHLTRFWTWKSWAPGKRRRLGRIGTELCSYQKKKVPRSIVSTMPLRWGTCAVTIRRSVLPLSPLAPDHSPLTREPFILRLKA